jgi:WD repeat-containing protein 24
MCALLSIVAAQELRIGRQRVVRFVEAYIGIHYNYLSFDWTRIHLCADILDRLKLYTTSAYLRKYVKVYDIQAATGVILSSYHDHGSS